MFRNVYVNTSVHNNKASTTLSPDAQICRVMPVGFIKVCKVLPHAVPVRVAKSKIGGCLFSDTSVVDDTDIPWQLEPPNCAVGLPCCSLMRR